MQGRYSKNIYHHLYPSLIATARSFYHYYKEAQPSHPYAKRDDLSYEYGVVFLPFVVFFPYVRELWCQLLD